MPDCRRELVMDATDTDDESLIGEECHIVGKSTDGPRGDISFPEEQLNKYGNLILLCRVHHKIVDDQPNTYSVELLKRLKTEHEEWVRQSLAGYDSLRQRDEEIYATYIETWLNLAHVAEWKAWTSHVLGADQPSLWADVDNDLSSLRDWIFSRIWPKRYAELEDAFENFRRVLQDFQNIFHKYSEKTPDSFYTRKFYHIDEWNKEKYERLYRQYIFHVKLVEDLLIELTRAANYICDKVRKFIDPTFRMDEGTLLITSGPYMDLSYRTHRVEYRGEERIAVPYPGIEQFKKIRAHRDLCFCVGIGAEDPEFQEWYKSTE
jgi:hypothetical protein